MRLRFTLVAAAAIQTITPGASDWTAFDALSTAASGSGLGSTRTAIGRFVCAPLRHLQDLAALGEAITGVFGVVASHVSRYTYGGTGIDYVKFCLDGGTMVTATGLTLNTETGRYSFNVRIDASTCGDAIRELRAYIKPRVGAARVLSLSVVTNATETLPRHEVFVSSTSGSNAANGLTRGTAVADMAYAMAALKTAYSPAAVSGGVVWVGAGAQDWDPHVDSGNPIGGVYSQLEGVDRAVTIAPDVGGGTVRADCPISSVGSSSNQMRLKWPTFYDMKISATINTDLGSGGSPALFRNCLIQGSDRTASATSSSYISGNHYFEDCEFYDLGWCTNAANLLRGCHFERVAEQIIKGALCVVGNTGHDLNNLGNGALHPDFGYIGTGQTNVVWEGNRITHAYTDGRGSGGYELLHQPTVQGPGSTSQLLDFFTANNLIDAGGRYLQGDSVHQVHDSNIISGLSHWAASPVDEADTLYTNNVIFSRDTVAASDGTFDNNHFITTGGAYSTPGTNMTSGGSLTDGVLFTQPHRDVALTPDWTPVVAGALVAGRSTPSRWGPQDCYGDLYSGNEIGAVAQ